MEQQTDDETSPLIRNGGPHSFTERRVSFDNPNRTRYTSFTEPRKQHKLSESITIKRHLNLLHAVGIMVGSVCGTGIFVSPTGVTRAVRSVGLTFVIWTVCGLFNLLLALCYAELGTAMPVAGGDYAYINHLLGPFPAFLCLWTLVIVVGPCAAALMGRTIGAYFTTMIGQDCHNLSIVFISCWITVAAAALNSLSVNWSAKLVTFAFIGKLGAMSVIIIAGIVQLFEGNTQNFVNIMEGSNTDPTQIVLAILPGFVTYAGWEAVTAVAEEMKNPKRDLPIATIISMFLVILIYLLINMAYFTVLSPEEFIQSDAVASNFANKALPSVTWLVPVFVMFSSAGSIIAAFLTSPRFTFAGGRDKQLPIVCSYIHIKYLTPIPAIILMTIIAIFFDAAVFFDINALLNIQGLIEMVKFALALIALIHLKFKKPHLRGTIIIPTVLVILSEVLLLAMIIMAIYADPVINGVAILIVASGIPIYFLKECANNVDSINYVMDKLTIFLQCVLRCVPEGHKKALIDSL